MKKRSLYFEMRVLLLLLCSTQIFAQEGISLKSVNLYSTTIVDRLWVKDHPKVFLKCRGHHEQRHFEKDKVEVTSSQTKGSTEAVSTGGNEDMSDFVAQTLNWNVEIDPKSVFKLRFSQEVINRTYDESRTECNTTKMYSNTSTIENRLKGRVSIVVPKRVYVIRLKALEQVNTSTVDVELKYEEEFAKQLLDKDLPRTRLTDNLNRRPPTQSGEYQYYFVKPGDVLDFTVQYETKERANLKASVTYEIALLGTFACDQALGDPSRMSFHPAFLSRFKQKPDEESFHQFVQATSCLREPTYMHELLINSHGSDVAQFITEFMEYIAVDEGFKRHQFHDQATIVAVSTLLDLTDIFLRDMELYCAEKSFPLLTGDLPERFKSTMKLYHFAALEYLKVGYLLDRAEALHVKEFLKQVSKDEQSQTTYAAAMSDEATLRFMQAIQFKIISDFRVFTGIRKVLEQMPQTRVSQNLRTQVAVQLNSIEPFSEQIANDLKYILIRYANRVDQAVTLGDLAQRWQDFQLQVQILRTLLQKDLSWFELVDPMNPADSPFTEDLHTLAQTTMAELTSIVNAKPLFSELLKQNPNEEGFDFKNMAQKNADLLACLANQPKQTKTQE